MLDISITLGGSRERQKWRLSCQRLNVMEMSEWCPCLSKVFKEGISLIVMLVSDDILYRLKEICLKTL